MSSDASRRLVRALSVYLGPLTAIDHRTTKWSSATFTGTRHRIWFDVSDPSNLDELLRNLPEADLPLPGHFVADIEVTERQDHDDGSRVGLAVLTIVEA
jgi:hypothetical protein